MSRNINPDLRTVKDKGFEVLITSHNYIVSRNDGYKLFIWYNKKFTNNILTLLDDDLKDIKSVLSATPFTINKVKEINYIFNRNNGQENHVVNILNYLDYNYPHILGDYNLCEMEFCDNGDLIVDGVIIPTKVCYV